MGTFCQTLNSSHTNRLCPECQGRGGSNFTEQQRGHGGAWHCVLTPFSAEGPVFYLADSLRVQGPKPKLPLDPMPLPLDLKTKLSGVGLEFQH